MNDWHFLSVCLPVDVYKRQVFTAPAKDFVVELNYGKVHSLVGKVIPVETIKSIVTLSLIHI